MKKREGEKEIVFSECGGDKEILKGDRDVVSLIDDRLRPGRRRRCLRSRWHVTKVGIVVVVTVNAVSMDFVSGAAAGEEGASDRSSGVAVVLREHAVGDDGSEFCWREHVAM